MRCPLADPVHPLVPTGNRGETEPGGERGPEDGAVDGTKEALERIDLRTAATCRIIGVVTPGILGVPERDIGDGDVGFLKVVCGFRTAWCG